MSVSLKIDKINFSKERCSILLKVEGDQAFLNRDQFCDLILQNYPGIEKQKCVNSHGKLFGDCMKTTSLPHIFEHCILSEIARSKRGLRDIDKERKFLATTQNLSGNLARIELNYYDDIETLRAIKQALCVLNGILATSQS